MRTMTAASGITLSNATGAVTANLAASAVAPLPASLPPPPPVSSAAIVSSASGATGQIAASRAVIDPSAGVVLQYLNNDGTLQSQSPSSAAVAYLRAGLTADGLSKQTAAVA